MADIVVRLLAAAAQADRATADDLVQHPAAPPTLLPLPEPPSMVGERGRHHLLEAARDLRFLTEDP
jgi:hypothetical protein